MRGFAALLVGIVCAVSQPAASQARGACAFLPKELAMKVSSTANKAAFDRAPKEERVGGGTACSYADISLQIDVFTLTGIERLRRAGKKEWSAVADTGADAAYFRNNKNAMAEMIGSVGRRTFTIQMGVPPKSTADKIKPNAIALAKEVAAKLR